MRRLVLLLGLLIAPLMWLGAEPAVACSCVRNDVPGFLARADAVARARLVEQELVNDGQDIVYTFVGSELFAGTLTTPGFEVRSPASGASCGLESMVVERQYVVFVEEQEGTLTANLCDGTRRASPRYVKQVEAITGRGRSFDLPPPSLEGQESVILQLLVDWAWWT